MFGRRYNDVLRTISAVTAAFTGWFLFPAYSFAKPEERSKSKPVSVLSSQGLTQTPDTALRQKIAAKQEGSRKKALKPQSDVRQLNSSEMKRYFGRGPYRNRAFNGNMPWQRSFRDVNLCNGNLSKSFTDIQIAPGRGQGLVLSRTYNSNDDRDGAFGTGWTHAYEIRMEEAGIDPNTEAEQVQRTDFFGGKHTYTRDADGLYSPPPYAFDETESKYDDYVVDGPSAPLEDTEKSIDGTTKHFIHVATKPDASINYDIRACDYIEDRFGNRTTLTYGFTATYADGSTEKKVTEVTDPVGRTLTLTWANLGTTGDPHYRITQVEGPVGTYRVTYDYYTNAGDPASYLNLWKVHLDTDGLNRVTTYTYASFSDTNGTENGLLASISDPLGHTVSYTYSNIIDWCFDGVGGGYPTTTGTVWVTGVSEPGSGSAHTWAIGNWYVYPSWDMTSSPVYFESWIRDNNGLNTKIDIDSKLRSVQTGVNSEQYTVQYDSNNNVIQKWVSGYRLGSGLWDSTDRSENTDAIYTSTIYTYGPHGNVLTQKKDTFPGQVTYTYYDASKYFQKKSITDADGKVSNFDYYPNNDPAPGNRGNLAWVRDAKYAVTGKQFEYGYNASGQKIWEKNLNDVYTSYAYGDIWGNLTQVIQDPSNPSLSYTGLARTTQMTYDISGHVITSTGPNGLSSTISYNTLGQPVSTNYPATAATSAETVTYLYDGNGRTQSITDNRGTTTLAYESGNDRVAAVNDPVTGTVSYTYGIGGERLTATLPGNRTWTYLYVLPRGGYPHAFIDDPVPASHFEQRYNQGRNSDEYFYSLSQDDPNSIAFTPAGMVDDQGRRVSFSMEGQGSTREVIYNQTFDLQGNLVSACRRISSADEQQVGYFGYSSTSSRGLLSQVKNLWHYKDASNQPQKRLIAQNNYNYDLRGQRTSNTITTLDSFGNPQSRTENYGYDALSRLTSVNYGDGQTQGYSFDAMGNRLTKTDNVTGNEAYTYNAANMMAGRTGAGATTYVYDANGNTLTGGGRTNTWDSQNRLTKVVTSNTTSEFTYGSDGLRRSSLVTDALGNETQTDYVYDGSILVAEVVKHYNSSHVQVGSTDNVTYLPGPQGSLYRKSSLQADPKWYVYDGLGSVVGEVDVLGNLSATKTHDVYGLTRNVSGNPTSRQGFVGGLGHISDDETGLIYMRARYYDPSVGRFVNEDPSKDGLNWFTYCDNDPVNKGDASGNSWDLLSMIVGIVIGVLGTAWSGILGNRADYLFTKYGLPATVKFLRALADKLDASGAQQIALGAGELATGEAEDLSAGSIEFGFAGAIAGGLEEAKGYTDTTSGYAKRIAAMVIRSSANMLEYLAPAGG